MLSIVSSFPNFKAKSRSISSSVTAISGVFGGAAGRLLFNEDPIEIERSFFTSPFFTSPFFVECCVLSNESKASLAFGGIGSGLVMILFG